MKKVEVESIDIIPEIFNSVNPLGRDRREKRERGAGAMGSAPRDKKYSLKLYSFLIR